jgi:putative phosphoesterase
MATRIGLVSDVHASPVPLAQALDIFAAEGVDDIVCAGDIAGYYDTLKPTVELLERANCKTIVGNHDQSYLKTPAHDDDRRARAYLQGLPRKLELEIEGRKILVVHANPPCEQTGGIRLLDTDGEPRADRMRQWTDKLSGLERDVLIVGHTHQVFALQLGEVMVINPGSSVFNHSCMILSLPELTVRSFGLGNRDIVKCWNFGMLYSRA